MEEDSGAKKPVTRLRRRLSVEQSEDVKSPSTPTKRRGTRLVTKPQLDLIDENIAVASPVKVTNKVSKDITDTPEDRSITPSRRSSRVKSNTSDIEEKTLTPSRRSTRINKSTSGSAVELTQPVTTSRALRVSRRNSQIGSDTETSVTPGKKTRMGRKDSLSSIDSQAESVTVSKAVDPVNSDIEEIMESTQNSSTSEPVINDKEKSSDKKRKSPRLTVKSQHTAVRHKVDDSSHVKGAKETSDNNEFDVKLSPTNLQESNHVQSVLSDSKDEQLLPNSNVTKEDKDVNKKSQKSEHLEVPDPVHNTRHRTRSWTTISSVPVDDGNIFSDSENIKTKNKRNRRSLDPSDFLSYKGSGDMTNKSKSPGKFNEIQQKVNDEIITNSKTIKKKKHTENRSVSNNDNSMNESIISFVEKSDPKLVSSHENKENILDSGQNQEISATEQLLAKASPNGMKTTVYIEDSDSNIDVTMKVNEKHEDQCVPVVETCEIMSVKKVEHESNNKEIESSNNLNETDIGKNSNISCEPMDIDETNITNVSVAVDKQNLLKNSFSNVDSMISEKEKKQEIIKFNTSEADGKCNKSSDHYTMNLSSMSTSQVLEKSNNENKSTLILSTKDMSISEMNISKSPKSINNFLSKSITAFHAHDKLEISKRHNSLNELSATPLIQKKVAMQTSTPVISLKSGNMKEIEDTSTPRKEISLKDEKKVKVESFQQESEEPNEINNLKVESFQQESEEPNEKKNFNINTKSRLNMKNNTSDKSLDSVSEGDSSDESSSGGNDFCDDAAEEASDDYESGDSRDEDEKQYEKEHEIIDKGETLTSEDEISHDSDYEKDSFVVSSDAEDNELLSGSGDNLSMSDNELTMSRKSKKKYDERKLKEQKKASKEMYESRHKLEDSNENNDSVVVKSKKYNRQRLDSTLLETEDAVVTKPKKNKRMRLDSTQDTSALKFTVDYSENLEEQRGKLSQSLCDNKTLNEKEITAVCDESIINKNDPLSSSVKQEPKTPQMALDISTVNFTVREEIEEIQLDDNMSVIKSNEFSDPLQSDDSSDSANEKFNQEYDSVLKNLSKQTKRKSCNISLNSYDAPKAREINPIVNELNLTQTKKKKKLRNIASELVADPIKFKMPKETDKSGNITIKYNEPSLATSKRSSEVYQPQYRTIKGDEDSAVVANNTDEESSDAIDFQLLFPEESNDSDEIKIKTNEKMESFEDKTEDFIPLKKSEAKTDIRKSIDNYESSLNKEKVKRKKKRTLSEIQGNPQKDESVKKKDDERGRKSLPVDMVINDNVDINASINKFASKKSKDMKQNNSGEEQFEVAKNASINESARKKKNDAKGTNSGEAQNEVDMNVSIIKSASKKEKDLREKYRNEEENEVNMHASVNKSASKKKKDKNSEEQQNEVDIIASIIKSASKKDKDLREKYRNEEENEADTNVSIDKSSNIKRIDAKRKLYEEEQDYAGTIDLINETSGKKNTSINKKQEEELHAACINVSITKSADKKKKGVKEKEQNEELIMSLQENTPIASSSVVHEKGSKNKKRKRRLENDEDEENSVKVMKETYFHKIHVPRLPPVILNQLDDKSTKDLTGPETSAKSTKDLRRPGAIATTQFVVEETKKRKLKPSNYLEESVYLNVDHTSPEAKRQKKQFKRPKVLPFMPTVSTSASGYTTNFKVNIIPQETQFVAQKSSTNNFRNDYLYSKKIKRLGTYELYKRQRTNKLSKF